MACDSHGKLGAMPGSSRAVLSLLSVGTALACDEGLTPAINRLRGSVTFRGALPSSTAGTCVVACWTCPQSMRDRFAFTPSHPPTLRLASAARTATQTYALALPNGTYHWVLAAWKKQGSLSLQNADTLLREAGYYRNPADTSKIGVVDVNGVT